MVRVIFHIDMDAFYASVEQRDNPAYRGKPLIVGSPPDQRGVVCAASYEARKFGVKSAMPSRTAGKLCPKGIFVRPRMEAYRAESAIIMGILESFTAEIERVSVDEAYMDMSAIFAADGGEVTDEDESGCGAAKRTGGPPLDQEGDADADDQEYREDVIREYYDESDLNDEHAEERERQQASGFIPGSTATFHATDSKRRDAGSLRGSAATLSNDAALMAALPLALRIKQRIRQERGLTSSIGIASNKFLAKLGSEYKKPDGLFTITDREKVAFLQPLSIRAIHGVGPRTAEALEKVGVLTIGDLQSTKLDLGRIVGSFAGSLKARAMGEDSRPVDTSDERKSISAENTFLNDTDHRPTLRAALKELAADVSDTLAKNKLGALTVQVKVRYSDFTTLTRQLRVQEPLVTTEEIYHLACFLLARHKLVTGPLRLIGIGVSTLVPPQAQQLRLFE